jgi:hypothetical protein
MLTTRFSKPRIMKKFVPDKNGPMADIGTLNSTPVLLGKNDEVF